MISKISDAITEEQIGNKAQNLQILSNNNFNVPNGIIISNESLRKIEKYAKDIKLKIEDNKSYAVRSSGLKEDMEDLSFAGLYNTYLNVKGKENVLESIKKCYNSRLNSENLEYCKKNNIDIRNLEMAVIVQEMVEADFSGIAFTVNPITGNDKEIVVEVVKGLGDKNVSGKAKPEKYIYNWYDECIHENNNTLLQQDVLKDLNEQLLNIQMLFGYPVDVEFAIKDKKIYFLQVRPITKIMFSDLEGQWTTANLRDGGVSSRLCLPLMASIFCKAFDENERNTFKKMKILKDEELDGELIKYFYGKIYWDINLVKLAFAKSPGFVERNFDNEFGLSILYEGNGKTTEVTLKYLMELPVIAVNVQKTVKEQMNNIEQFKEGQLKKYKRYYKENLKNNTLENMEKMWKDFISNEYFLSEETYFHQIYINIIKYNIIKKEVLKIVKHKEYLNILSGIPNLSHIRPLKKEIEIINKMLKNNKILNYWKFTSENQILKDYNNNKNQIYFNGLNEYIEEYGYHSNSDLDLTVEPYFEDVKSIIIRFKNNIITGNLNDLLKSNFEKNNLYIAEMDNLKKKLTKRKFKKLEKEISEMKKFMWWREELKDLSNRYYALVKKYTKALAQKYYSEGILKEPMDIYYLEYTNIIDFIDKNISKEELYKLIEKNKKYCKSFVNFRKLHDIDKRYNNYKPNSKKDSLKGIGCSTGIRKGKVRVVKSLSDINKIQKGEILVTKFIDTGWISRFGILNGVISEYGGTLCHSSIVAREYEIPAIVGIENAEKIFKDGEIIEMNGETGEIRRI